MFIYIYKYIGSLTIHDNTLTYNKDVTFLPKQPISLGSFSPCLLFIFILAFYKYSYAEQVVCKFIDWQSYTPKEMLGV